MKKTLIILVLAALAMVTFPLAAAGATYFDINTHGGWTSSTAGCADCHTTHAGNAAFLLANGPSETDACYACHGTSETASPYNVEDGAIYTRYDYSASPRADVDAAGTVYPSYAGGFNRSWAFDSSSGGNDAAQDSVVKDATHFAPSSSAHNVEEPTSNDIPGSAWSSAAVKIPGGSATVIGDTFKCGSCHDPHAGTNSNIYARLLRTKLPADGTATYSLDFATDGTVSTATYRVTAYPEAINTWCAGCHDYFDAADNAGHTADANSKFRHPMGVAVSDAAPTDATISYGTPLAKTTDELICFSCHRAHGTASSMTGAAESFKRYNGDAGATSTSSALLRMKNRDTCYNCHGAAEKNTWTDYGGSGAHSH